MFEARKRTQKLTQLLVVEGYMDVVALAQNDINYAVATLGTATSGEHLERMFRLVSRLVFCFDGDNAGRNAAWKALAVALPLMRDGRSARFLFLPDGEDPDSLVRKEGKDKFEWRLDQAQPLPDFFFNKLQADIDIKSLDGKAHLSNLAMPMINEIPSGVFKQLMIEQLSILTGLAADKLVAASASVAARYVPSAPKSKPTMSEPAPPGAQDTFQQGMSRQDLTSPANSSRENIEFAKLVNMAIAMLLRQPELSQQFDEKAYSRLEAGPGSELLLELIHAIVAREITSPVMLLATWQDRPEFDYLRDLIEQEQLLDVSELPEEFTGVINTLLRLTDVQSGQLLRADLLSKPFDEMSESEREMLKNLVKSRHNRK